MLDMVRSMMSRATLPISFWGYALETAAKVLNLIPTKKVSKTPSEIWNGKSHTLTYLRVWGCECYVRCDAQDKLEPRSEKSLFIGYPGDSFGYLFYNPKENKVFVSRRAVFLEKDLISKRDSGSRIDLEEIQEPSDMEIDIGTSSSQRVVAPALDRVPDIGTSSQQAVEPTVVREAIPQPLPIRRSDRVRHEPERYGLNISESCDVQIDSDEPTSYQEAMVGPESAK